MRNYAKRANCFEKNLSESQWIHRILLIVSFISPSLLFSLNTLSSCNHSMLFPPAIHPRPQEAFTPGAASANLCLHLSAQPLKLKKTYLSRFYPFLITCENLPRDEENSNACQNADPLVSLKNPQMLCFFWFLCLALTLVKTHKRMMSSNRKKF